MKKKVTQQQVYDMALENFGVVPGIIKEAAERSTAVAYLYANGIGVMEGASFNSVEMNAIELKISVLNHCLSCTKGHSYLLKKEGVGEETILAIIKGEPVADQRINILVEAAECIYHAGSDEFPTTVIDFLDQHLSEEEIVDIIGLISLKTISNYINNYLVSVKQKV